MYQRIPDKNWNQKLPAKILYYFSYFQKLVYYIAFLYKSLHFTVAVRRGKSWVAVLQSWPWPNEYTQSMFLSRNKKNNVYPCKPQFIYIKEGLKGVNII